MGTSNFHNKNATVFYSVSTEYYDEELDENMYDESIWECTRDEIARTLKEKEKLGRKWVKDSTLKIEDELRSFSSTSIGEYWDTFKFCGEEFRVALIPHTTNGYYSGFNLDWNLNISTSYMNFEGDCIEDFIDNLKEEAKWYSHNTLLLNIPKLEKRLEKLINELVNEVEEVFASNSGQLKIFAEFSNGETLYKQVG